LVTYKGHFGVQFSFRDEIPKHTFLFATGNGLSPTQSWKTVSISNGNTWTPEREL